MRVLHLWDNYAPGLFDQTMAICHEEGVEAALVAMHWIDRGVKPPKAMKFVRRISEETAGRGILSRVSRKLATLVAERRFRALVRREIGRFRPDLLHVHYGTTGAILASSKAAMRLPFLVSFYGFDISQGIRIPRIRRAYCRLMQRRPLVHVLCDEAAKRVQSLGADPDCIVDANLPLPVERYPDLGIAGPVARWLIPARFVEKKGHDVLLRAFRLHLSDHPGDHLTCWGYGDARWLEKRVGELGLVDRVSVIDNRGQGEFDAAYLKQLNRHDAVLAPSVRSSRGDDEGGPALTAVLAQVAGKPVILSDFPGSERSVTDGVEGLIAPQGDPIALSEAMHRLASDPDAARRMGAAGRTRATREFSRTAFRDSLLGWYRTLAA